MKYIQLFEAFKDVVAARPFIEQQTLKFINDISPKSIVNEKFVTVYHGTSLKNVAKIAKSGMFKKFTFFALDYDTAYKFARLNYGESSTVLNANVYIGSLLPSSVYLTSNEDLFLNSSFYVPKGYKFDWLK